MYQIGVIPGDGIGPEVIEQSLRVLAEIADQYSFDYKLTRYKFGAVHYFETGELITNADIEDMRNLDAILLGAVGDPRIEKGLLEKEITAHLWNELDLFAEVRHVRLYKAELCPLRGKNPEDIDFVLVRDNLEGIASDGGSFYRRGSSDEIAFVQGAFTRRGAERVIRFAFETARRRRRKQLTLVEEVYTVPAHDLWKRVFRDIARDYPDVSTVDMPVASAMSWMVNNPEWFDVVVMPNLIGSSFMSVVNLLQGGPGFGASAYLHPGQVSLFEPVHGAAVRLRGTGTANPVGAVMALSYMLRSIEREDAADAAASAVERVLSEGDPEIFAPAHANTIHIGDLIIEELRKMRQ